MTTSTDNKYKGKGKGFASMSPEKRREIAQRGGRELHRLGLAHKFSSEEAQIAGSKGGTISRRPSKKPQKPDVTLAHRP